MKANYIVCYDIVDDKRLSRVFRFFKAEGDSYPIFGFLL